MLIDTNVLIHTLQPPHPHSGIAQEAIELLRSRNERLHLLPQNLIEFWTVATRPISVNGLGLSTSMARFEIERLERLFVVLPETPLLYSAWKRLVIEHGISGKPTYDARLVAAMLIHGVGSIFTFNAADFKRYHIAVVTPFEVVA